MFLGQTSFEFALQFHFTAQYLLHERKYKNGQRREVAFSFRLLIVIKIYQ